MNDPEQKLIQVEDFLKQGDFPLPFMLRINESLRECAIIFPDGVMTVSITNGTRGNGVSFRQSSAGAWLMTGFGLSGTIEPLAKPRLEKVYGELLKLDAEREAAAMQEKLRLAIENFNQWCSKTNFSTENTKITIPAQVRGWASTIDDTIRNEAQFTAPADLLEIARKTSPLLSCVFLNSRTDGKFAVNVR